MDNWQGTATYESMTEGATFVFNKKTKRYSIMRDKEAGSMFFPINAPPIFTQYNSRYYHH